MRKNMVAISCCHEFYEQFARNHINDSMGSAEISLAMLFFLFPLLSLLKDQSEAQSGIRWVALSGPGSLFHER